MAEDNKQNAEKKVKISIEPYELDGTENVDIFFDLKKLNKKLIQNAVTAYKKYLTKAKQENPLDSEFINSDLESINKYKNNISELKKFKNFDIFLYNEIYKEIDKKNQNNNFNFTSNYFRDIFSGTNYNGKSVKVDPNKNMFVYTDEDYNNNVKDNFVSLDDFISFLSPDNIENMDNRDFSEIRENIFNKSNEILEKANSFKQKLINNINESKHRYKEDFSGKLLKSGIGNKSYSEEEGEGSKSSSYVSNLFKNQISTIGGLSYTSLYASTSTANQTIKFSTKTAGNCLAIILSVAQFKADDVKKYFDQMIDDLVEYTINMITIISKSLVSFGSILVKDAIYSATGKPMKFNKSFSDLKTIYKVDHNIDSLNTGKGGENVKKDKQKSILHEDKLNDIKKASESMNKKKQDEKYIQDHHHFEQSIAQYILDEKKKKKQLLDLRKKLNDDFNQGNKDKESYEEKKKLINEYLEQENLNSIIKKHQLHKKKIKDISNEEDSRLSDKKKIISKIKSEIEDLKKKHDKLNESYKSIISKTTIRDNKSIVDGLSSADHLKSSVYSNVP